MFNRTNRKPKTIIAGVAAGIAIGGGFAVASHNYPLGLALGIGIGLALTVGRARRYKGGN